MVEQCHLEDTCFVEQWLFLLVLGIIASVVSILVLMTMLYHLSINRRIRRSIKYFSVCSTFCFVINLVTDTISKRYMTYDFYLYPDKTRQFVALETVLTMGWSLGILFLYLLFIERIRLTFCDTIHAVPSHIFRILHVALTFLCLSSLISRIIYILYYLDHNLNIKIGIEFWMMNQDRISIVFGIIAGILHLFVSLTLIYLFTSRLLRTLQFFEETTDSTDTNSAWIERKWKILNVASKYCVISSIAIISSEISLLFRAYQISGYTKERYNGEIERNMSYTIGKALQSLDSAINCICIMLSFGFHHELYGLLCKKCDVCCRWCCVKLSSRVISEIVYETSNDTGLSWECEELSETSALFGNELCEMSSFPSPKAWAWMDQDDFYCPLPSSAF